MDAGARPRRGSHHCTYSPAPGTKSQALQIRRKGGEGLVVWTSSGYSEGNERYKAVSPRSLSHAGGI